MNYSKIKDALLPLSMKLQLVILLMFPVICQAQEIEGFPLYKGERIDKDWLIESIDKSTQIYKSAKGDLVLSNGLISRVFDIKKGGATIALENLMTGESELRAIRPEAMIQINGEDYPIGGLVGQSVQNYLTYDFIEQMEEDPSAFHLEDFKIEETKIRFEWERLSNFSSSYLDWPAPGKRVIFTYRSPKDAPENIKKLEVKVVYEMYNNIPVMSKWIEIENAGAESVRLNSFKAEILALVEKAPKIDSGTPREWRIFGSTEKPEKGEQLDAPRDYIDRFTQIFAVTDYAMGGDMEALKDNPGIRWVHDHPEYEKTGIRYYGQYKPARMEATLPFGPELDIVGGKKWESFRVFEMVRDATDEQRRGLAEQAFWKAMAPWSQENPIFMHVRSAEPEAVKLAIDQAAEVGFEMVIMTFGSGFNIESTDASYVEQMKKVNDYAVSKGIMLGGYSLLASRGGKPEDLIISQETGKPATSRHDGARFGKSPCLASVWGHAYIDQMKSFIMKTGIRVLEHDGSYPGDYCASESHEFHHGFEDSQWKQWEVIRDFYHWCRGEGVYLNVPDWYFMSGSSKTAMGYVETNWSLPREQQEIIERQNIYDGTWNKTPSMGWMFVPLVEYHGGGKAATIEPLKDHLPHYEQRLANLFGAGVQAIYRGPQLYDSPKTKAVVSKWVDFYKEHREVLDAEIIHVRRADGRDYDGLMHVNPFGAEKGLIMLYNPLDVPIVKEIKVDLYYTGLKEKAELIDSEGKNYTLELDRGYNISLPVNIPANGQQWFVVN